MGRARRRRYDWLGTECGGKYRRNYGKKEEEEEEALQLFFEWIIEKKKSKKSNNQTDFRNIDYCTLYNKQANKQKKSILAL